MIRKRSHRALLLGSFGFPAALFGMVFGVRIPHTMNTVFEMHPRARWVLSTGNEGQIISSITDFCTGTSPAIRVIQFERGESMDFRIHPSLTTRTLLQQGDSVAVLASSRLSERLAQVRGELRIAVAELAANAAGSKVALVEEAGRKVEYSEAKVKKERALFARAKELFARGFVSQEQFDAAEWEVHQAELEHQINTAQWNVQVTGSKDEELQVLRSTIRAHEEGLAVLERQAAGLIILAPLTGEIVRNPSRDTLLIVQDRASLVLRFPLRVQHGCCLAEGDSVRIRLNGVPEVLAAPVVAVAKEVVPANGIQVVYCRLLLPNPGSALLPGLILGGEIVLPPLSIAEFATSLLSQ